MGKREDQEIRERKETNFTTDGRKNQKEQGRSSDRWESGIRSQGWMKVEERERSSGGKSDAEGAEQYEDFLVKFFFVCGCHFVQVEQRRERESILLY